MNFAVPACVAHNSVSCEDAGLPGFHSALCRLGTVIAADGEERILSLPPCFLPQIYWFKDGKQISPKSDHYTIQRDLDGTCSLHTTASTLDDDGNYTIMAANPQVKTDGGWALVVLGLPAFD